MYIPWLNNPRNGRIYEFLWKLDYFRNVAEKNSLGAWQTRRSEVTIPKELPVFLVRESLISRGFDG